MKIGKFILILLPLMVIGAVAIGVYAKDEEKEEPVKEEIEVTINYSYHPVDPFEFPDGIMPDDIYNLDEFNKNACLIAQTLYGESRGLSTYEQSMVVWCILNRVDNGRYGETIEAVIKAPGQFLGYHSSNPIDGYLYNIAVDVLMRWSYEKYLEGDCGRTLPREYIGFYGKDGHNKFRNSKGDIYDFSAVNPY